MISSSEPQSILSPQDNIDFIPYYLIVLPPSITIFSPVIRFVASLAKNKAIAATSSGYPKRPSGISFFAFSPYSPAQAFSPNSVKITVGEIAFTSLLSIKLFFK